MESHTFLLTSSKDLFSKLKHNGVIFILKFSLLELLLISKLHFIFLTSNSPSFSLNAHPNVKNVNLDPKIAKNAIININFFLTVFAQAIESQMTVFVLMALLNKTQLHVQVK
jgi:hypothetical protein